MPQRISFIWNKYFKAPPIFQEEKDEQERRRKAMVAYPDHEHAYGVLHSEYPDTPMKMITEAVATYWDFNATDEQNIITCRYLSEYNEYSY